MIASHLKTSDKMKAAIYAGRHELYFDQKARLVDTFQAIVQEENFSVNVHLSPNQDCYETSGVNMADLLASRGVTDFEIRNGLLYDWKKNAPVKKEKIDDVGISLRGVPANSLASFRKGLLAKLRGATA